MWTESRHCTTADRKVEQRSQASISAPLGGTSPPHKISPMCAFTDEKSIFSPLCVPSVFMNACSNICPTQLCAAAWFTTRSSHFLLSVCFMLRSCTCFSHWYLSFMLAACKLKVRWRKWAPTFQHFFCCCHMSHFWLHVVRLNSLSGLLLLLQMHSI